MIPSRIERVLGVITLVVVFFLGARCNEFVRRSTASSEAAKQVEPLKRKWLEMISLARSFESVLGNPDAIHQWWQRLPDDSPLSAAVRGGTWDFDLEIVGTAQATKEGVQKGRPSDIEAVRAELNRLTDAVRAENALNSHYVDLGFSDAAKYVGAELLVLILGTFGLLVLRMEIQRRRLRLHATSRDT